MSQYTDLIVKEEAKLELLRKKVAACERLIAALRGAEADDVDAAIAKQISTVSHAKRTEMSAQPSEEKAVVVPVWPGIRVRKGAIAPLILQFIGREGKSLDDIEQYIASTGKPTSRGTLRTVLMNLRAKNGFVDNPAPGFYKLSEAGAKAIGFNLV